MEKAVAYLAAGMSKRFGGKIKALTIVGENGETLIEISINQALKAGFNKIIFIVGNKTETAFKEKFGNEYKGAPVEYAYQYHDKAKRDKPWGTTDALCTVKSVVNSPFVICNADELFGENTFKKMYEALDSEEETTVGYPLGDMLSEQGEVKRGIFTIENRDVTKIKETFHITREKLSEMGLKEDNLCNVNVFALHPRVLDLLIEKVNKLKEDNPEDRTIESLLPEDISRLIESGEIKLQIFPSEDKWIGITNPGDEIAVREFLKNN